VFIFDVYKLLKQSKGTSDEMEIGERGRLMDLCQVRCCAHEGRLTPKPKMTSTLRLAYTICLRFGGNRHTVGHAAKSAVRCKHAASIHGEACRYLTLKPTRDTM
jgi:hypothetical protein